MTASWGAITAGELLSPIGGDLVSGAAGVVLKGLSTDTRNIREGDLFWALQGGRFDGHDFIAQALERGAAGVVANRSRWRRRETPTVLMRARFPDRVAIAIGDTLEGLGDLAAWWRREHSVQLVAVTGSSGKTTTKEMTACILELSGPILKNRGNFNNLIGLPLSLLELTEGVPRVVLEMGMNRFGEISRLTEISDPDIGIITNVGMAHLEGVGDMEGVARAKTELVERISPRGRVILNGDDALLMKTAAPFGKSTLTFGLGPDNDIRAEKIRGLGRDGIAFDLRHEGRSWGARLSVAGAHNVYNALAAAAAGLCLGEPPERVLEGLERFRGVDGRFTVKKIAGGAVLVNDTYNANPSALKAALDSAADMTGADARLIVGLGEMGELGKETVSAHHNAGRIVARRDAGFLVALGEHAGDVIRGALEEGMPRNRTMEALSHADMARRIRDAMGAGDVILIKGSRIMELEKVVEALL
ncbi:MAG: UDP-N-acetylmuramoyl-tripeptide--D-alanyl-D-alanine ligase [Deltaproteobacteria bacterium]|nr:UDP-N-acetylmuramoyl-tripeptide--D-alanyl-D-alanine ligase [Deltaproteobacteria bacterium]MBW2283168.1 UDP-N-acetylmuramoyl-tripeptide--D-alanyl-D-alanine ligase [Deltaproteobacteria bacterium]